MEQISVTEIRRHAGAVLARIVRGECLAIMRDGKPVAILAPASDKTATEITATDFVQHLAAVFLALPVVITDHERAVAELRAPDAINESA